jgi:hypothetical protein
MPDPVKNPVPKNNEVKTRETTAAFFEEALFSM